MCNKRKKKCLVKKNKQQKVEWNKKCNINEVLLHDASLFKINVYTM